MPFDLVAIAIGAEDLDVAAGLLRGLQDRLATTAAWRADCAPGQNLARAIPSGDSDARDLVEAE